MRNPSSYSKKSIGSGLVIKYILPALVAVFLCHLGSLNLIERYLGPVYQEKIENHYIGNTTPLLNGTIRFNDAVSQNIQRFLSRDRGIKFFNLDLNILITSEDGEIVYPAYGASKSSVKESVALWDNAVIARENFNLLHQHRKVFVVPHIRYISPGSGLILLFYLIIAFIIAAVIRRGREKNIQRYRYQGKMIKKFKAEEQKLRAEAQKLKKDNETNRQILENLDQQRRDLVESLKEARAEQSEELRKASINEADMIDEIDRLEQKLNKDIALQQVKEQEIERLKKQVARYERRKGKGGKRGTFDFVARRFATLYKNVDMNRRALTGFFELNDNQQIKAEEIIHQIDQDVGKVIIKRKVFSGKKDKTPSFEVLFAYNGRLYFRNLEANRVEILVIGTKNTQDRDMEFLHQL